MLVADMVRNFHESYASEDIGPPSERSTGFVFAAVAALAAVLRYNNPPVMWLALSLAVALTAVSFICPSILRPFTVAWFRFGRLLHRIVNPIVMFAIFVLVFVPAGALIRIWHDPLRLRRLTGVSSYWIDRSEKMDNSVSMTNQF